MAGSPSDILTVLKNGVVAISNLAQALSIVTTTSSGVITINLTQVSSA